MEELQKTEILKKGQEIGKELGKTAGKAAESISKSGEQISQTAAYKTMSEVGAFIWWFFHTCLPLWIYRICSWKSWKSIMRSRNMDSLSKVLDSVIHEKQQQQTQPFWFSPESSRSVCARTYWSHFWTCFACAKDRNNVVLFCLGSALHGTKDMK